MYSTHVIWLQLNVTYVTYFADVIWGLRFPFIYPCLLRTVVSSLFKCVLLKPLLVTSFHFMFGLLVSLIPQQHAWHSWDHNVWHETCHMHDRAEIIMFGMKHVICMTELSSCETFYVSHVWQSWAHVWRVTCHVHDRAQLMFDMSHVICMTELSLCLTWVSECVVS